MFYLTSLDIRNFDISKVTNSDSMFNETKTGATVYVKEEILENWIQNKYPSGNYIRTG